jgi:PAS domain S-box-containing protein
MWLGILAIIITFLSGLANLVLAIYVFKKDPKARLNKNFFYLGLAVLLWHITKFTALVVKDPFWVEITYATGSLLPVAGIFFTYALADKKLDRFFAILLLAFSCVLFFVFSFSSLFIQNIKSFSELGFKVEYGPLFSAWGFYIILLTLSAFYIPISVIKQVSTQRKKQILYFITGIILLFIWVIIVSIILPVFGFTDLTTLDTPSMLLLMGFTGYAIIKYNLMNISSLFFQAFIFSLVIILIVALLLLLMFIGSFLFAHSMIWPLYLIAGLIAIILFFIGRLFFKEKQDLEKGKINLTKMLEKSEENRIKAEIERDKTTTIVSSFTDGLIILDEKNKIFSINPEAEKILELDRSEFIGKSFQFMTDYPRAKQMVSFLNADFRNINRKEAELAKGFIIELSVIPLDLNKNNIGHLIVLHDVSREKIVERMKTEFVSLAAHQLRTPLSIIKWSMSMLDKGDFGKLTKKQSSIIKNTFQNNERLISLVDDLLDVTRIEEGRYLYKVEPANIKEITLLAIESCKDEIQKRKIKIDFEDAERMPELTVDAEKIKLVIQNFIDNAVKYSPEGGRIIIGLQIIRKNIELKVQDFGIGIPKDQQDKIFTKFFRGNNAIKVNTVGSGLGLFFSKNIIEAHGGKMWFESIENEGTSFYFSLPIKKSGV